MTKSQTLSLFLIGFFSVHFCMAQTPKEIILKIISSKDYLNDQIDLLYSSRLKKSIGDRKVSEIAEISDYCDFSLQLESVLENTASICYHISPKEGTIDQDIDSFFKGEKDIYFLFKKEDNQWKLNDAVFVSEQVTTYHKDLLKAVDLYEVGDYKIPSKTQEEVDWSLKTMMRVHKQYSKENMKSNSGINYGRIFDNYFTYNLTGIREAAYILSYYNASSKQIVELRAHLNMALNTDTENIKFINSVKDKLEKQIKKNPLDKTRILKWLEEKAEDWSEYNIEALSPIGFVALDQCPGCLELSFTEYFRYQTGALYIPNKKDLPTISMQNYIMLKPLGGNWYYFKAAR